MVATAPLLALAFLANPAPAAPQEAPSARAIVARALKACGIEDPGRPLAFQATLRLRMRVKGPNQQPDIRLTWRGHSAGGPTRVDITIREGRDVAARTTMTLISRGDRVWSNEGGAFREATGMERDLWRAFSHTERVCWLLPLLQDGKFTLTARGEREVEGEDALTVLARYPGRSDVLLYFDKEAGHVVRADYTLALPGKKESVIRLFYHRWLAEGLGQELQALRAAKLPADGPGALAFLRRQTDLLAHGGEVKGLIAQLGDRSFPVRDKAARRLLALGKPAVAHLRIAASGGDLEASRRARRLIEQLGGDDLGPLVRAAARVLACRKPAGAAEALLDYLPGAAGAEERQAVEDALLLVAFPGGKPGPALLRAAKGEGPRAAAAAALLARDRDKELARPGRRLYLPLTIAHRMTLSLGKEGSVEMDLVDFQVLNRHDERLFRVPE